MEALRSTKCIIPCIWKGLSSH